MSCYLLLSVALTKGLPDARRGEVDSAFLLGAGRVNECAAMF